jgi:hypothetical protein
MLNTRTYKYIHTQKFGDQAAAIFGRCAKAIVSYQYITERHGAQSVQARRQGTDHSTIKQKTRAWGRKEVGGGHCWLVLPSPIYPKIIIIIIIIIIVIIVVVVVVVVIIIIIIIIIITIIIIIIIIIIVVVIVVVIITVISIIIVISIIT